MKTFSSWAEPTPRARLPCSSPSTRGASSCWCAGLRSPAPCRNYLIEQIRATENIELQFNSTVVEAFGDTRLEEIAVLCSQSGDNSRIKASSLFIFIGAVPNTDWLNGVVERDEKGFILSGADLKKNGKPPKNWPLERDPGLLETSVPGIFVIGDVRKGSVKRVASGVGEGSIAIQFVHQYLETK